MGFRGVVHLRRQLPAWLCIALLASVMATPANAQAPRTMSSGVTIVYFEPLRTLPVQSGAAQKRSFEQLVFEAYGRRFELQLEPNDRIFARYSKATVTTSLQLLRGSLVNIPGSWVRLARTDAGLTGMLWDGSQLYLIEPAAAVRDSLVPPLVASNNGTVIFRLADTLIDSSVTFCATTPSGKPANGQDAYDALLSELRHKLPGSVIGMQAAGASLRLEVSALGDTLFRAQYASDDAARDAILLRLNNVDGIYSSQLGVAIQAPIINVSAAATQSLSTSTAAQTLLTSLGQLRFQSAELRSKGLTHLFTGRDLDGNIVGIGNTDVLCHNQSGVALTEVHPQEAWFDSLVAAHEIGHNFGAVHDGDGPARSGDPDCRNTPVDQFLMAANVNANHSTFSQCSLDTMRPRIQAASCIAALAPPDLAVANDQGTLHEAVARPFELSIPIANRGGLTATGVSVEVLMPPSIVIEDISGAGWSCISGGGRINCTRDDIAGGATTVIELLLHSDTVGSNSFSVTVEALNDATPTNNSGDGTIVIDPEADLGIALLIPDTVATNAGFTASFTVNNLATIASGAVTVELTLPPGTAASSAAIAGIACPIQATRVTCTLSSLSAAGSATGSISLSAQSTGVKSFQAEVAGSYVDPDAANNHADASVNITDSGVRPSNSASSSDGGGGGAAPGLLVLLTLLASIRGCRKIRGRGKKIIAA